MALAMQAIHAPVVPAALQGSSQAANPSPIAGSKVLICMMMKFAIEMKQAPASPPVDTAVSPVVVSSVSVSVSSVLVPVPVLARAGGLNCRISRPATSANNRSFCACILLMKTVKYEVFASFSCLFQTCFLLSDAESEVSLLFIATSVI